jgi:PGF-pre-PGF domain-containing protein
MFVNITGNISAGEVNTAVEVLKTTSTLVNTQAPGTVYMNANIWVGTSGFAIPKNIKDAVIRFRVENSWLEGNNLASGDIWMLKWNKTQWIQLETAEKGKDGTYTYFESRTNSFSSFAITALKGETVSASTPETTISAIETPPADSGKKPDQKAPMNLAAIIVVLFLIGIIVVLYLRRK